MKKRGVGIAAAQYPTGLAGGGDVSQAYVKVNPYGTADLFIGSVDIGPGSKTVLAQMAAAGVTPAEILMLEDDGETRTLCKRHGWDPVTVSREVFASAGDTVSRRHATLHFAETGSTSTFAAAR